MSACLVDKCGNPTLRKGYCNAHYLRLWRHGDPLGGGTPKGDLKRWINDVALRHTGDECLTWPFSKNGKGYGTLSVNGKTGEAHRYICNLVNGPPPTPKHQAAHSCGKGHEACISPIHLGWKTNAENKADKLVHGTHNRGERHVNAKLTEPEAREILSLKGLELQRQIAKRFMVSPSLISGIHAGLKWSWLSV